MLVRSFSEKYCVKFLFQFEILQELWRKKAMKNCDWGLISFNKWQYFGHIREKNLAVMAIIFNSIGYIWFQKVGNTVVLGVKRVF